MNVDRWTLYLAEADSDPEPAFTEALPGVERLAGRLWLYPGHLAPEMMKRPVPYGEHPLYGRIYARPIASGEGTEALAAHPAVRDLIEGLLNSYTNHLLAGSLVRAEELAARLRALGQGERLKEAEERAQAVRPIYALLRASGAPVGLNKEGKVVVGNPPAFTVETFEEAENVAATYAWARRERVEIRPMERTRQGQLRFAVDLLTANYTGGDAVTLPLTRKPRKEGPGVFRLVRRREGVAVEPLGAFPPRDVVLLFLPHNRTEG